MSSATVPEPQLVEQSKPAERSKPVQKGQPRRQPRYHVILWDDNDHSYPYVIRMLRQLFAHPFEKAYEMASHVDRNGRVTLLTTTKEHAELKRDQVSAFGPDQAIAHCKGSMYCTIEPAE
ncbi:MAG: ATP-dependent Clp protease adaptor ClpS [Pirellulales bacterium]